MSRELIYCKDVHRGSFVLLYVRGSSDSSWSIRDYSVPGTISVRYAKDFRFSLSELLERSTHRLSAPATSVNDLNFWHSRIQQLNLAHLIADNEIPARAALPSPSGHFPLLDEDGLYALPKAAKASDMRRIFTSANSEDWVTWNTFAMLRQVAPDNWWPQLLSLARKDNPQLNIVASSETPVISLWECLKAPRAYEHANRIRMKTSGNAEWERRALSAASVEGESEIDIILRTSKMTCFIEAKLGSDVSSSTTYDPVRNQIGRNIDCLLETCGATQPVFWMMVRDRDRARDYTRLMRQYRDDPVSLSQLLPHRSLPELTAVTCNLATVLWSDVLSAYQHEPLDSHAVSVRDELHRRARLVANRASAT